MLIRTQLTVAFIAVGAMALVCSAMLVLANQRHSDNQERAMLANQTLSGYLQLSGRLFRTFKQARRDLLSGTDGFAFDILEAEKDIRDTLKEIEISSSREHSLSPSGDLPLASDLATLSNEILTAFDEIRLAELSIQGGQIERGRVLATETLETRIDGAVSDLIENAILLERNQLEDVRQNISQFGAQLSALAWGMGASSVLLVLLVAFTVLRRMNNGLLKLEHGANEFAEDNLAFRFQLDGGDEFSQLAGRFNVMAGQLLRKRHDLQESKDELESRVKLRTLELSELNEELKSRENLRRRFFADIGHELRTPVTAIRGEAEVALRAKTQVTDTQHLALEKIVELSEQLTTVVNDLFLIAREQAGVLDLRTEEIELNAQIAANVEQMQGIAKKAKAKLRMSLHGGDIFIEGDRNRISQLVRVLVTNAIHHSQEGVEILIWTCIASDRAVVSIEDNGPGIALNDRNAVFERFVRAPQSATENVPGTGLGLPIAKSLALAHGGDIEIRDSRWGGTAILVSFPIADDQEFE
ncbi:MAG: HAMP domain-containing protein [Boseongicola sp.]|nr:MAG: HAMP domain-containing protein [Boseongicola sp.]